MKEPKFKFNQVVYVFDSTEEEETAFFKGRIKGIFLSRDDQLVYTVTYPQGHNGNLKEEEIFTSLRSIVSVCKKNIEKKRRIALEYLKIISRQVKTQK